MGWSGIDTRRAVRVSFECIVVVKKRGSSLSFQTETEDISLGGVCVVLEKALLKRTPVELKLSLPDDFPVAECKGKVIWVSKRNEYLKRKPSQFDTGIEFIDMSEQDKVRLKHIIDELLEY